MKQAIAMPPTTWVSGTKGVSSRRRRHEGMQRTWTSKFKHDRLYLKLVMPFNNNNYGYTMSAHTQFTRVSSRSHSYAIKQIHGRSQPPFPYTAVANIRKTPPRLNLDIHVAICGSYMPSRRLAPSAARYALGGTLRMHGMAAPHSAGCGHFYHANDYTSQNKRTTVMEHLLLT